ncbi:RNA polymerase III subunit C82 [Scheffersomyces spartinae]|uniref:DNA-directed RNA polymerase III subunit RPC3 n=1 Tax=Scheffersomyces spartinae TaxID=45513 RepID=A0A9P7V9F1_9ASCO|nr:RNA polymerase III subunit C82 [Scheffersomyces spartinae]KAG7193283.1 RNA polymerase III subunit C82 [Scheffersomyces spartinae]
MSKLLMKKTKQGLVSLVQMNCVLHWKEADGSIYYSFDEDGMFVLIHGGDIIHHLKTTYNDENVAEVVQNIIAHGHLSLNDYLNQFELEERISKENMFLRLYNDGWLVQVTPLSFSPLEDVWQSIYQESLRNTPRNATTSEIKRVNEAKEASRIRFMEMIDTRDNPKDAHIIDHGVQKLNPELVVKFSLSRYEKHLRTELLAGLIRLRIGPLTAEIFRHGLKIVEKNSPNKRHYLLKIDGIINDPTDEQEFVSKIENRLTDDRKIVFTVRELLARLPKSDELVLDGSILTENFAKPFKRRMEDDGPHISKKIKLESDSNSSSNGNDFNPTTIALAASASAADQDLNIVSHHLRLLTAQSFLIEVSPGSFAVPFTSLTEKLREHNFEMLVKSTLGPSSFRILRCLKRLKLGDEKLIASEVFLKGEDLRSALYKLVLNKVVEIQEVPRSADRAASKTFFLYRHKPFTSYLYLKELLCFSMAQCVSQVQKFRDENKLLLSKTERVDVKGFEEEMLMELDFKALQKLRQRELFNLGKFNRIKSLYSIFQ